MRALRCPSVSSKTFRICKLHGISASIASSFFFFNDTATTEIYTLSLHDALPICYLRAHRGLSDECAKIAGVDRLIGQQVEVGLHLLAVDRQHLQGYPDMRCPHGNQDRRSISLKLVARSCGSGIELCGHEDGAGIGVGEQVIARLVVQEEVIAACPIQHLLAAAAQDGDIEGFDLDLLKHLCGISGCCGTEEYSVLYHGVGFELKALQCPGATFFDVDRHCR